MMPINVLTMCLIILLPNRLDRVCKSYFDGHRYAVSIIVAAQQYHSGHYKRGKTIFRFFFSTPSKNMSFIWLFCSIQADEKMCSELMLE